MNNLCNYHHKYVYVKKISLVPKVLPHKSMQQVTQKRNKKVLLLFLILILVSSIILVQYADAVGTTFTTEINLSNTNFDSPVYYISKGTTTVIDENYMNVTSRNY